MVIDSRMKGYYIEEAVVGSVRQCVVMKVGESKNNQMGDMGWKQQRRLDHETTDFPTPYHVDSNFGSSFPLHTVFLLLNREILLRDFLELDWFGLLP